MRTADPLEPEVEAALEAIDATLAGDPVDPEHAELAELALILRADRPPVDGPFAVAMDERVRERFAQPSRRRARLGRRPLRGWLVWAPAGALAAVVLVVALVTLVPGGGSSVNDLALSPRSAAGTVKAPAAHSAARGASSSAGSSSAASAAPASAGSAASASAGSAASGSGSARAGSANSASGAFQAAGSSTTAAPGASAGSTAVPQTAPAASAGPTAVPPTAPTTGSRQVVQSARLALSTRPGKLDAVAQEVFDVVGSEKGYVANSSVTATGNPGANAEFSLSVPSANLQQTLIALAQLPGATVVSSTDTSQDITGQVGGAGRRLAEARALLRSLLRQLATADTTEQIGSLTAQIHDANATIDRDQASLNGLHRQVQYSRISVTIQGSAPAPAPAGGHRAGGSGFTLHRAGHDAVRVLVVAAGVLLIALAVAVPLALVVALVAWLWLRLRRHRRESALDRA